MKDCIELGVCRNQKGYGRVSYKGQLWSAHRLAWYLLYGPIPKGKFVLHKCDNPACVNTLHLYLGDHQDNMNDMKERGRASRLKGSKNASAKLTEGDVSLIKKRINRGESLQSIAIYFGVDRSRISRIASGHAWRHV